MEDTVLPRLITLIYPLEDYLTKFHHPLNDKSKTDQKMSSLSAFDECRAFSKVDLYSVQVVHSQKCLMLYEVMSILNVRGMMCLLISMRIGGNLFSWSHSNVTSIDNHTTYTFDVEMRVIYRGLNDLPTRQIRFELQSTIECSQITPLFPRDAHLYEIRTMTSRGMG
jgi:hypothetical protein